MIRYVQRNDLDEAKYNDCINSSRQNRIYAYSWYLDIVVDHWDVLILNDYEAVMPIPNKKKYFVNYVYPPFWILQLGIFSRVDDYFKNDFINSLKERFKFVELRLNSRNTIDSFSKLSQFQELKLTPDYESIKKIYKSDREKDLKKAIKNRLEERWGDSPKKLINLFENNVGKRTPNINQEDYKKLNRLMNICIDKKVGEVLSIYQSDKIVASAFFLKNKKTVTILCSSTDFANRKNGANTFLIDRAIFKYLERYDVFNFGGSSIQSIANYFLSFGAKTETYEFLKINNLPSAMKLFKK